ncbi:MAG TPA: coproporphyrinogen III oxidase, partial [Erythrobacter sp.]|nr:coproporphyrinogen III oxidase [Erythrobacter sp.]
ESRHNLTYWRYLDYIGIGPGAHGRRCDTATVRHRKPENYLGAFAAQQHGIVEARPLGRSEQASEALLMGLRLLEGVDLAQLAQRFGAQPETLIDARKLALYRDLGMAWSDGPRIGVTPRGMPVLDALLGELVQADLVTS